MQAPLFCYQQEMATRLLVTIDGIQEDVKQHGCDAMQIASWVKINM